MSSRDSDDDLRALVAELEATLSALQAQLDDAPDLRQRESRADSDRRHAARSDGRRDWSDRRRDARAPRPPSLSELLRFTEEYTLPTLIATLEAAVQSLELLRGALRIADPERSAFDRDRSGRAPAFRLSDGVADVGRGAVSGVERALSELQTALSESDLPEDDPSRTLLEDARSLSDEIADRLAEASRDRDSTRYGYRDGPSSSGAREAADTANEPPSGAIEINVRDALDSEDREPSEDDDTSEGETADTDAPTVDVEAELASIKEEVESPDVTTEPTESGAADDEDSTATAATESEPDATAEDESDESETAAAHESESATESEADDDTSSEPTG